MAGWRGKWGRSLAEGQGRRQLTQSSLRERCHVADQSTLAHLCTICHVLAFRVQSCTLLRQNIQEAVDATTGGQSEEANKAKHGNVNVYLCRKQHLSGATLMGAAPLTVLVAAQMDPGGAGGALLCALRFTGMARGTTSTAAFPAC